MEEVERILGTPRRASSRVDSADMSPSSSMPGTPALGRRSDIGSDRPSMGGTTLAQSASSGTDHVLDRCAQLKFNVTHTTNLYLLQSYDSTGAT